MTAPALGTEITHPTAVYRFFDVEGALLYVGITGCLRSRLSTHLRKNWATEAVRVDVVWYPTRDEAGRWCAGDPITGPCTGADPV